MRPQRRFNARDLDFGAVVDAAIQKFEHSLTPSSQIEIQKSIAQVELYADETQWHSALAHLLANARFALATGGALKISLTRETISDDQGASLNVWPGEAVKLVVSDNGFGMNEATQPTLNGEQTDVAYVPPEVATR